MRIANLCILILVFQAFCYAAVITDEETNLLTGVLAAAWDISEFAVTHGADPGLIDESGTYTSTDWTATIDTLYLGQPLLLDYTGAFDSGLDDGSWTASGTYLPLSLASAGSAAFDQNDPMTGVFDTFFNDDPTYTGGFTVKITSDGISVGITGGGSKTVGKTKIDTTIGLSYNLTSKSVDGTVSNVTTIPDPKNPNNKITSKVDTGVKGVGKDNKLTLQFALTESTTSGPEPSYTMILAILFAGLVVFTRLKAKRRA